MVGNKQEDKAKPRYLYPWYEVSLRELILIENIGSDDYVSVLANAQFLRDQGDSKEGIEDEEEVAGRSNPFL